MTELTTVIITISISNEQFSKITFIELHNLYRTIESKILSYITELEQIGFIVKIGEKVNV